MPMWCILVAGLVSAHSPSKSTLQAFRCYFAHVCHACTGGALGEEATRRTYQMSYISIFIIFVLQRQTTKLDNIKPWSLQHMKSSQSISNFETERMMNVAQEWCGRCASRMETGSEKVVNRCLSSRQSRLLTLVVKVALASHNKRHTCCTPFSCTVPFQCFRSPV